VEEEEGVVVLFLFIMSNKACQASSCLGSSEGALSAVVAAAGTGTRACAGAGAGGVCNRPAATHTPPPARLAAIATVTSAIVIVIVGIVIAMIIELNHRDGRTDVSDVFSQISRPSAISNTVVVVVVAH